MMSVLPLRSLKFSEVNRSSVNLRLIDAMMKEVNLITDPQWEKHRPTKKK